ncbi:MAG: M48 family metallopeptidase [Phycisphaerae bacterium]|nr:M48 family metallopeptidase [Phycisphaerae bacterium]
MAGPKIRKGKWLWQSLAGSETDAIAAEYDVGRDLAAEVARQVRVESDGDAAALVRRVGSRLAACVANKNRKFTFAVLEGAEPNAFALPGGFIYITCGLIELCRSDHDELAFVLGHEMAHVIRGHAMDRIVGDTAVQTLARTSVVRGALGGWLKRVGVQFLQSAYSQDREFEADNLGVSLVRAAHFDMAAPERLLKRLYDLDRQGRLSELTKYFSSHPPLSERANAAAQTAASRTASR